MTTEERIEKIDPELNEEFQRAGANVNETADAVKAASMKHHSARAVFEYVGGKIREKYGLGPMDRIQPDGTIIRVAPDATA
jgi:hypothetical protein